MARVYIIAGPNGAGKTTFATEFLPLYTECRDFINVDLIAHGISPFSPDAASFRAGRIVLQEIKLRAGKRQDFAFETTLSGLSYIGVLRDLKGRGYHVTMFFVVLETVEATLARIGDRVSKGGHDVPENVVRRRFDRSLSNFFLYYKPLADFWMMFDNSQIPPAPIALL